MFKHETVVAKIGIVTTMGMGRSRNIEEVYKKSGQDLVRIKHRQ